MRSQEASGTLLVAEDLPVDGAAERAVAFDGARHAATEEELA